jgi:hypothetical protein
MQARSCAQPAATARVHLFPRRKAGDSVFPEKGRLPVKVDRETIEAMFGMPQPDASRALGVSLTALKQVCRKLGIARWPYQRPCKRGKRCRSRSQAAAASCAVASPAPGTAATEPTVQEAIPIPASPESADEGVDRIADGGDGEADVPDDTFREDDEDLAGMSDSADSYYSSAETARDGSCFEPLSSSASRASSSSSAPCSDRRAPFSDQAMRESFACPRAKDDDDYDLGWLVPVEDYNEAYGLEEEDLNFELAWRERLAVERQKVHAERLKRGGGSSQLTL